jgi:hypothetical protein
MKYRFWRLSAVSFDMRNRTFDQGVAPSLAWRAPHDHNLAALDLFLYADDAQQSRVEVRVEPRLGRADAAYALLARG